MATFVFNKVEFKETDRLLGDMNVQKDDLLKDNRTGIINIGDRFKILHTSQKRTLQEIADASELSRSMISKIENHKTVPSVAVLVKIAHALSTNISGLLGNNDFLNLILTSGQKAKENFNIYRKGLLQLSLWGGVS